MSALPRTSDIDLFGDREGIIDLDAKIPCGTLNLAVTKQELHGAHIAGPPVDQSGPGAPQQMRTGLTGIQPDAGDPFSHQAGVLPGGEAPARVRKGLRMSALGH